MGWAFGVPDAPPGEREAPGRTRKADLALRKDAWSESRSDAKFKRVRVDIRHLYLAGAPLIAAAAGEETCGVQ